MVMFFSEFKKVLILSIITAAVFDIHMWTISGKCSIGLGLFLIVQTKIASWLWFPSTVLSSASIIESILVFKSHRTIDVRWLPINFKNSTGDVKGTIELCGVFFNLNNWLSLEK